MKVTVEIDEMLLNEAMELAGVWTQRAAIELALRELLFNLRYKDVPVALRPKDQELSMRETVEVED